MTRAFAISGARYELIRNGRHFQRTIRYSANGCVEMMMGGIIDLQGVGVATLDYQEREEKSVTVSFN